MARSGLNHNYSKLSKLITFYTYCENCLITICIIDNVLVIPDWMSGQLCRAITGSGFPSVSYILTMMIIYNFKGFSESISAP